MELQMSPGVGAAGVELSVHVGDPTPTFTQATVRYYSKYISIEDVVQHLDDLGLRELIDRQNTYRCLGNQTIGISLQKYIYNTWLPGHWSSFENYRAKEGTLPLLGTADIQPDSATLERTPSISVGTMRSFAFYLYAKHRTGSSFTTEDLQEAAKAEKQKVEWPGLRGAFIELSSKGMVEDLLTSGTITEEELESYFSYVAQWQVATSVMVSLTPYAKYSHPYPYGRDLEDVGGKRQNYKLNIPDVRFVPYIFRNHYTYLEFSPELVKKGHFIEDKVLIEGVKELYAFGGRVVAFYSAPEYSQEAQAVSLIQQTAEELSPKFTQILHMYRRNPLLISKEILPGMPSSGSIPSLSDRSEDIKASGGKAPKKPTSFRYRREVQEGE